MNPHNSFFKMPNLLDFPLELHFQYLSYLPEKSIFNLLQVSRFFRSVLPKYVVFKRWIEIICKKIPLRFQNEFQKSKIYALMQFVIAKDGRSRNYGLFLDLPDDLIEDLDQTMFCYDSFRSNCPGTSIENIPFEQIIILSNIDFQLGIKLIEHYYPNQYREFEERLVNILYTRSEDTNYFRRCIRNAIIPRNFRINDFPIIKSKLPWLIIFFFPIIFSLFSYSKISSVIFTYFLGLLSMPFAFLCGFWGCGWKFQF
jgi:hypothetical protein